MWTIELHYELLDMSQLCYCYINPPKEGLYWVLGRNGIPLMRNTCLTLRRT